MVESLEAAAAVNIWILTVIVLGALLAGLVIEFGMLRWLQWIAHRTHWLGDDVIIKSLRGMPLLWCLLVGVYLILPDLAIDPRILELADDTAVILAIVSVTIIVIRLTTGFIGYYADQASLPSVSLFNVLLRIFISLIGVLVVMAFLDVSVTPAVTALAASGIGISFALRESLANLFSGLLLVASNKIHPGDYIRLHTAQEGYVTDINWHTTQIRQFSNNMIIVPNSIMANSILVNTFSPAKEMSVYVDMGISYESDLERAEEVTIEVANAVMQQVRGGVPKFQPAVFYHTFDEYRIRFWVVLRAREYADQYLVTHEFMKRLRLRYREEGITISYPVRTLHTPSGMPLEMVNMIQQNGHAAIGGHTWQTVANDETEPGEPREKN